MVNQRDRAFHLTVTFFAVGLAAASAFGMVHQHNPGAVTTLIYPSAEHQSNRAINDARATGRIGNPRLRDGYIVKATRSVERSASPAPATSSVPTVEPASSMRTMDGGSRSLTTPTLKSILASGVQVLVKPAGPKTTQAQVGSVQQLLSRYRIADTVSHNLQMSTDEPVYLYLAQTQTEYKDELARLGLSQKDANQLSQDTGGFTQGNTMIIALFQNGQTPDLVNTIAHELTHVILNANVNSLPSWINEGLAVYDGMQAQSEVEDAVSYDGYARRMAEGVLDATASGQLVPLAINESQVLQGNQTYDLELQDWLAVRYLIQSDGFQPFYDYLNRLKLGEAQTTAFNRSFHETYHQVNDEFTLFLKNAAHSKDQGVDVSLTTTTGYRGAIRVLQHSTQMWQGATLRVGDQKINITPTGRLMGALAPILSLKDTDPPDDETVYINLAPKQGLLYNRQKVQDCGFALDYHYGMYAYVNTWITLATGQSVYLHSPSLFGVKLSRLTEHAGSNPVIALLRAVSSS